MSRVRSLGLTVAGENYGHPAWREAFIVPDGIHGTIIQLAQNDNAYPKPVELLARRARDHTTFPSTQGATDPTWWTSMWDSPTEHHGRFGSTYLGSSDLTSTRRLFAGTLGAEVEDVDGSLHFHWSSGALQVQPSSRPGISGMDLVGGPRDGVSIGAALLTSDPQRKPSTTRPSRSYTR